MPKSSTYFLHDFVILLLLIITLKNKNIYLYSTRNCFVLFPATLD